MNRTRIAIVGAGVIGKRHLAALARCPDVDLAAICDPFPAAADIALAQGVKHFSDIEAMLAAETPDGVVVATPTEHHLAPTLAALDAGVPVLVEKPITATPEEAESVVAKSKATGCPVLVGHHRRYYACVHKAREIVGGGGLGQLVGVNGQWTTRKPDAYYASDWRKRQAAGPVLTNLIHEIDSLRYICGEIVSVTGLTANAVQGFEKEDVAALAFEFASGALGTFLISDQAVSPWTWEFGTGENASFPKTGLNSVHFMGTHAALDFPNLTIWRHAEAPGNWEMPIAQDSVAQPFGDAFRDQLLHFADVIGGRSEPRIDAADALRTLQATVAIFEASRTGQRAIL